MKEETKKHFREFLFFSNFRVGIFKPLKIVPKTFEEYQKYRSENE